MKHKYGTRGDLISCPYKEELQQLEAQVKALENQRNSSERHVLRLNNELQNVIEELQIYKQFIRKCSQHVDSNIWNQLIEGLEK